jgi:hypothetical protein
MSETHPTEANGWEFSALDCAVGAADAAMQGTLGIWNAMDPHDRDRWLESRGFDWPRLDIFLRAMVWLRSRTGSSDSLLIRDRRSRVVPAVPRFGLQRENGSSSDQLPGGPPRNAAEIKR